jgi:probable HAF family extracellular repeat protein
MLLQRSVHSRGARSTMLRLTALTLGLLAAASVTLRFATPARADVTPQYTLTDLGTLPGGEGFRAQAINQHGQVVGNYSAGNTARAFLWEKNRMRDIGMPPGATGMRALAINEGGKIVGSASYGDHKTGRFRTIAVSWQAGRFTWLPSLGGSNDSANAINDAGTVVGESNGVAVRWEKARIFRVGTLPNDDHSFATGINKTGAIIGGSYSTRDSGLRGFISRNGQLTELKSLGGPISQPYGLNDALAIVGESETTVEGRQHATTWVPDGFSPTDYFQSTRDSYAEAINNLGAVVGWYERFRRNPDLTKTFDRSAYIRPVGATDLTFLNDVVPAGSPFLVEATDINDKGQIVGEARVNDQPRAFLLTPAL